MSNFNGKVAIITGGVRGIGAAIAMKMNELGASVIVTGRSSIEPELPKNIKYISVDFSMNKSILKFIEKVEDTKDLSVLINNAGINRVYDFIDFAADDFNEISVVNYKVPYLLMQSAARAMIRDGIAGRIINIGSIWATHSKEGRTAYCGSKAGLVGLTRAVATDLAKYGILVNAVSPGFVETDLTSSTLSEEEMMTLTKQIPLGRMAKPSEIANVVAMLASETNTYITGQNIIVDGGFTNV
jgi:3-oxoacyl-[acyl-carrier protein] reductase